MIYSVLTRNPPIFTPILSMWALSCLHSFLFVLTLLVCANSGGGGGRSGGGGYGGGGGDRRRDTYRDGGPDRNYHGGNRSRPY